MDKNKTNKHDELLKNEDLRKKLIDKIEVLNKVKELILLPNTELMTTRMVADYYEVSQDVIRDNIRRHKEELVENGLAFKKYKEIKEMISNDFNSKVNNIGMSRNGSNLFTIDSIIVMSFFIKKSKIAEKVRDEIFKNINIADEYKKYFTLTQKYTWKENDLYNKLMLAFKDLFKVEREVFCDGYYIDFVIYNNEKKIAIECDEHNHDNYNIINEKKRGNTISRNGYVLFRINPDSDTYHKDIFRLINNVFKIAYDPYEDIYKDETKKYKKYS